jgi:hypothetical protein
MKKRSPRISDLPFPQFIGCPGNRPLVQSAVEKFSGEEEVLLPLVAERIRLRLLLWPVDRSRIAEPLFFFTGDR